MPLDREPAHKGSKLVLQPDEGVSFWQPRPANGYITIKVSPDNCASNAVTMGVQVVAPNGCYVREHWHSRNEEILFCFEGRGTILFRMEGFNLFNHGNILGRAQTTYGDSATVNPTFGEVVAVGTAANALPALANIDPPRMVQFQVRYLF